MLLFIFFFWSFCYHTDLDSLRESVILPSTTLHCVLSSMALLNEAKQVEWCFCCCSVHSFCLYYIDFQWCEQLLHFLNFQQAQIQNSFLENTTRGASKSKRMPYPCKLQSNIRHCMWESINGCYCISFCDATSMRHDNCKSFRIDLFMR